MSCSLRLLGLAVAALAEADVSMNDVAAMDDACGTDSSAEECSLSLRQLRGERITADVNKHEATAGSGGFCCYAGTRKGKTCSTCMPKAKALEFDYCASADTCGGSDCKGTWCKAQCVYSGYDANDICGTAYKTAIAPETSSCSESESQCGDCSGTWCGVDEVDESQATDSNSTDSSNETSESEPVAAEEAVVDSGFCCYAGTSKADICGSCLPDSIATDTYCSASDKCGGCGGTWCSAQCVYSGSDPDDICGTAYADAIAPATEVCSKSESKCTGCGGHWCTVSSNNTGNAKVVDVSPKNVTQQRAENEDPEEADKEDTEDAFRAFKSLTDPDDEESDADATVKNTPESTAVDADATVEKTA